MRLIIDTLIVAMLVAILAGIILHYRAENMKTENIKLVHQSLARLQEQMMFHEVFTAVGDGDDPKKFLKVNVSPLWFENRLPENPFVPGRQPWMDVAPAGDMGDHPPDPIVKEYSQAGFWYNPNRGIFRARVAPQYTEEETLKLYNMLNTASLFELPQGIDPNRLPVPLNLQMGMAKAGGKENETVNSLQEIRARMRSRPTLLER